MDRTPTLTPPYWQDATRALAARDAVLRRLIPQFAGLAMGSRGDAFATLARAIVGQQLSVKAAQTVWNRLSEALTAVTPATVARAEPARLLGCGLSGRKMVYLQDLAARFAAPAFDVAAWHALDDEHLIEELTRSRGIGRWTAEMFLIFYMARPDVLPLDDLGLQRAMRVHYNRGRPLSRSRMQKIGDTWAPWRSVATWYLWRGLDPQPVQY